MQRGRNEKVSYKRGEGLQESVEGWVVFMIFLLNLCSFLQCLSEKKIQLETIDMAQLEKCLPYSLEDTHIKKGMTVHAHSPSTGKVGGGRCRELHDH